MRDTRSRWQGVFISLCLAAMGGFTTACGGGGGGKREDDIVVEPVPATSEEVSSQARVLLDEGNVEEALSKYDEALALNPSNTEAAFGAALTRLVMLSEAEPTNTILDSLGQNQVNVSNLVGPQSYLAELNSINQTSATFDTFTSPFFGKAYAVENSYVDSDYDPAIGEYVSYQIEATTLIVTIENLDRVLETELNLDVRFTKTNLDTGEVVSQTDLAAGAPINVSDEVSLQTHINGRYASWGDWVDMGDEWGWQRTGTIVAKKVGSLAGDAVEVEFQNVVLDYRDSDSGETKYVTLTGTVGDQVSRSSPDKAAYLPFFPALANRPHAGLKTVLAKANDSVTTEDYQAALEGYVPLFEEIEELLAQADQDNAFQFVIPKGLYFGQSDIPVNRIDLKLMRGAMDLARMGFYLANSWFFPVTVGTLYDESGNRLITKEDLVDQLNQFFGLKTDHYLQDAELALTEGLQRLLEAHDLLSQVTVDGTIEQNPLAVEEYQELHDLVAMVQNSLAEQQVFTFVEPAVPVNLNAFFAEPPDAASIDFDPFVIEEGQIRPVEAFFQKLLEGVVDYDTALTYRKNFPAIQRGFGKMVFEEFHNFFAAGERLFWFEDENEDEE